MLADNVCSNIYFLLSAVAFFESKAIFQQMVVNNVVITIPPVKGDVRNQAFMRTAAGSFSCMWYTLSMCTTVKQQLLLNCLLACVREKAIVLFSR